MEKNLSKIWNKSIKDMEQKTPVPCDLTSECYEIGKGEISITSDMQMTPPLWQKVKKN